MNKWLEIYSEALQLDVSFNNIEDEIESLEVEINDTLQLKQSDIVNL